MKDRAYIAIDLKSFYASVECVERGLDPLKTNLLVADESRTEKTICLAVSPSLKSHGIPGRPRLFEVVQRVKEVNSGRLNKAPGRFFTGSTVDDEKLKSSANLALGYIIAPPRMALYMEYSTRIYSVYLKYIAPEDIHVYSIDEVFIDATNYLETYKLTAHELAMKIILDIIETTGITATAGIGTNLYLAKIAMDIGAKQIPADEKGVRIAVLDEASYRRLLWSHRPLTDFWRVGRGYAKKLEENGLYTMGDIARCSLGSPASFHNEDLLYKLFGVNAELLIDHAWGWEPCTMADIKAYRPASKSLGSGQVLQSPYSFEKAKIVVREMTELLVLDLLLKNLLTNQMVLTVGYDIENLNTPEKRRSYKGEIAKDSYGRLIPKQAHGSINLETYSASARQIVRAVMELFDKIVDEKLLIRRLNLTASKIMDKSLIKESPQFEQLDLFTDYKALEEEKEQERAELEREQQAQRAILEIRRKFGKNAILKGTNLKEGATTKDRNEQIGGHKA